MSDFSEINTGSVLGRSMAWRDVGESSNEGLTFVLVHGNPTSSYLWRGVVPHLSKVGRCLAPDLIGMGASDKLPDQGPRTYSYFVHRDHFDGWMEYIGVSENIVFVGHNWGVPLTFDWATRHPGAARGFVHMEGQVAPVTTAIAGERFQKFNAHMHSPEMEADVLNDNIYLTEYFYSYVSDLLSEEDRAVYDAPYVDPGVSRRPTLDWPCEIPVDGSPADVHQKLLELIDWMGANDIPKLWLMPDTGSIMIGERKAAADSFSCQAVQTIEGGHYTPETSPDAIGRAIVDWIETLE